MPRFAVDYSGWIYVDALDAENAFSTAYDHLANILDDFEIVNVEEGV